MKNQYVGLILGIFILIGIVVMNRQIMQQVEDAYKMDSGSPVAPSVSNNELAASGMNNSVPVAQPVQEDVPIQSSAALTEPAANEETGGREDNKVIYQMPLEDVKLAQ